jgi:hypothetical protein
MVVADGAAVRFVADALAADDGHDLLDLLDEFLLHGPLAVPLFLLGEQTHDGSLAIDVLAESVI